MTNNKSNLFSYKRFGCSHEVILSDNSEMYTEGKGKLRCCFGLGDNNESVSNYTAYSKFGPKFAFSEKGR